MENVHAAIAWYQTKIGSYDKQLWEQSVERKLQKQPKFVLHSAPRKKVRLKTEYIDVDLIRGSMFTKAKPQVPWVYVTRKAIARVLFFPFYFNWWVHQTSRKVYVVLLVLYVLQVVTVLVYLSNFDSMEDELSFTEVILPIILMFLLCLIHSQTVLAHISHKPPKHNKSISGVTRKSHPKKPSSRRVRSSDNKSMCQENDGNTEVTRASKWQNLDQHFSGVVESHSFSGCQKNLDNIVPSSIDVEGSLMSQSLSDYDLKPAVSSSQNEVSPSGLKCHKEVMKNSAHRSLDRHRDKGSNTRKQWGKDEIDVYSVHGNWGDGSTNSAHTLPKSGCSYNLLDNLPNLLTVEKVFQRVDYKDSNDESVNKRAAERKSCQNCQVGNGNLGNIASNSAQTSLKCGCSYKLLDNLPNCLQMEKVSQGVVDVDRLSKEVAKQENCQVTNGKVEDRTAISSQTLSKSCDLWCMNLDACQGEKRCSYGDVGIQCSLSFVSRSAELNPGDGFSESDGICDRKDITKLLLDDEACDHLRGSAEFNPGDGLNEGDGYCDGKNVTAHIVKREICGHLGGSTELNPGDGLNEGDGYCDRKNISTHVVKCGSCSHLGESAELNPGDGCNEDDGYCDRKNMTTRVVKCESCGHLEGSMGLNLGDGLNEDDGYCDRTNITAHFVMGGVCDHLDIPENVCDEKDSSIRMRPSEARANICSCYLEASSVTLANKDVSRGMDSHRNMEFVNLDKMSKGLKDIFTCSDEDSQKKPLHVCEVSIEHPSFTNDTVSSNFEMDAKLVLQEKGLSNLSGHLCPSLTTCCSNQAVRYYMDISNLTQSSYCEGEAQSTDVRCDSHPFRSQCPTTHSSSHTVRNDIEIQNITSALLDGHETQSTDVKLEPNLFRLQGSSGLEVNTAPLIFNCANPHKKEMGLHVQSLSDKKTFYSAIGVDDDDEVFFISNEMNHLANDPNQREPIVKTVYSDLDFLPFCEYHVHQDLSAQSDTDSSDPPTVRAELCQPESFVQSGISKNGKEDIEPNPQQTSRDADNNLQSLPQMIGRSARVPPENHSFMRNSDSLTCQEELVSQGSSNQLQFFSEFFVQEILNEDTLREMSCSSLLAHSDLENSSSSVSHISSASGASSVSSSSCKLFKTHRCPLLSSDASHAPTAHICHHHLQRQHGDIVSGEHRVHQKHITHDGINVISDQFDESLKQTNLSEEDRHSDDVSNYNPSDSDVDSDGSVDEDVQNRYEDKWKRLRFQDLAVEAESSEKAMAPNEINSITSDLGTKPGLTGPSTSTKNGFAANGSGSRSVVEILTRKPSPLKDLTMGRKSNTATPVPNSSGSDKERSESRTQLRRRRQTSGTAYEIVDPSRSRNIPSSLGLRPSDVKLRQISSSENEVGGLPTPEELNKATISSEEWEDRIQSDETTSSAYSSNSEVDHEEEVEEEYEERTEYTTNTFHVINLLQPQNGSPTNSANVTQPDRVSCMILEGNECKKIDLTALDIGWAIIDKVDSLPESSDYFLIGLLFSVIISMVPLIFRAYANKDLTGAEDLLTWSGLVDKLVEIAVLVSNAYSWRQYLVMVNGIFQRFFLSLIFFFLLSVADRTFKQRLLYAKHFSYLTSSRRARKFSMPHFRLNKVRNIKIWLSLRSYLKRRGPQRSVDVINSACFLVTVSIVCLISLQTLKDTESFLDYLCNWELLVWCTALGVFLMRFMTLGLKINKKYRNLSVLITEQINLYLQMEQKPHKKEELILANNVLRLAEDLLKELESPFKISGFSANPLIYNIMRIVVLSAFSAVLTEILGFKLKLHKIKFKG